MEELNVIADISDYQKDVDFEKAKDTIKGILIKATQGINKLQKRYETHSSDARKAGLLVGSYHFGENSSGRDQAEHFLDAVGNYRDEPLAIDVETWKLHDIPQVPISLQQVHDFVLYIHAQTGKWPGVYGGDYLKSLLGNKRDEILANCWLWLAEYGSTPRWPTKTWSHWTMWQYTGDGKGPKPHNVDGIGKDVDRSKFGGNSEEFERFWKSGGATRPVSKLLEIMASEKLFVEDTTAVKSPTDIIDSAFSAVSKAAGERTTPLFFPNGIQHIELSYKAPAEFKFIVSGSPQADKLNMHPSMPLTSSVSLAFASDEIQPTADEVKSVNLGVDGKGDFPAGDVGLYFTTFSARKTVDFDTDVALKFLHACETSDPRVRYKLGAKIKPGQIPGRDFKFVDCSGFSREIMRLATDLKNFPDGSVIQHDWIRKMGFEEVSAAHGLEKDGVVRIAFLSPASTKDHIGHVLVVFNGNTIESHGHVGPDSRVYADLPWYPHLNVFNLTAP